MRRVVDSGTETRKKGKTVRQRGIVPRHPHYGARGTERQDSNMATRRINTDEKAGTRSRNRLMERIVEKQAHRKAEDTEMSIWAGAYIMPLFHFK